MEGDDQSASRPSDHVQRIEPMKGSYAGFAIYDDVIWGVGPTLAEAAADAEEWLERNAEGRSIVGLLRIQPCTQSLIELVRGGTADQWETVGGVLRTVDEPIM